MSSLTSPEKSSIETPKDTDTTTSCGQNDAIMCDHTCSHLGQSVHPSISVVGQEDSGQVTTDSFQASVQSATARSSTSRTEESSTHETVFPQHGASRDLGDGISRDDSPPPNSIPVETGRGSLSEYAPASPMGPPQDTCGHPSGDSDQNMSDEASSTSSRASSRRSSRSSASRSPSRARSGSRSTSPSPSVSPTPTRPLQRRPRVSSRASPHQSPPRRSLSRDIERHDELGSVNRRMVDNMYEYRRERGATNAVSYPVREERTRGRERLRAQVNPNRREVRMIRRLNEPAAGGQVDAILRVEKVDGQVTYARRGGGRYVSRTGDRVADGTRLITRATSPRHVSPRRGVSSRTSDYPRERSLARQPLAGEYGGRQGNLRAQTPTECGGDRKYARRRDQSPPNNYRRMDEIDAYSSRRAHYFSARAAYDQTNRCEEDHRARRSSVPVRANHNASPPTRPDRQQPGRLRPHSSSSNSSSRSNQLLDRRDCTHERDSSTASGRESPPRRTTSDYHRPWSSARSAATESQYHHSRDNSHSTRDSDRHERGYRTRVQS